MGAQTSKSDEKLLIGIDGLEENFHEYIQRNDSVEREEVRRFQQREQEFMNELQETVIPDFSFNLDKNSVKVAAFSKIRQEPGEKLENLILKISSETNKSVEIESNLFKKETHNPKEENNNLKDNKCVELYEEGQIEFTRDLESQLENINQDVSDEVSNLKTNAIKPDNPLQIFKIKSELLMEDYNLQIENPDAEINVNLEAINSVEINEVQNSYQVLCSDKTDNSYINEIHNFVQNREIKLELLNTQANEFEPKFPIDKTLPEILNSNQKFKAGHCCLLIENSNADALDNHRPPKDGQNLDCNAENLNISVKGLHAQKDIVLVDLVNIEKPFKEIKIEPSEVVADLCMDNINIARRLSHKTNVLDNILNIEKPHKKNKIDPFEIDDSDISNSIYFCTSNSADGCDAGNLNRCEKDLAIKTTELDKNINKYLRNIEESHQKIKNEPIELVIPEYSNINGNTANDLAKDCIVENLNIIVKDIDISVSKSIFNENINDNLLKIQDQSKVIKIESAEEDIQKNSNFKVQVTDNESFKKLNLVKNPFAFLREFHRPIENQQKNIQPPQKFASTNTLAKAEIIIDSDDELKITNPSTIVVKKENDLHENNENTKKANPNKQLTTIKSETVDDFVTLDSELPYKINSNWNDANIKRDQIEEYFENNQLQSVANNFDFLNASLDVNIDNSSTPDVDDIIFTKLANDLQSNSTQTTLSTSSEYYSIIDLSSLDDFEQKPNVQKTKEKKHKIQGKWRGRPRGSRNLNPRKNKQSSGTTKLRSYSKDILRNKNIKKKSKKYSEKDSVFSPKNFSKKFGVKNLPKTDIVTRTKETTHVLKSTKLTLTENRKEKSLKEDFPKPIKLEMASNVEKNIATDLPKPFVYKLESSKATQVYNTPEFQPYVRLKRLKSPDLLVPLKIRKISNRRNEYKKPTNTLSKSYPFVTKSNSQYSFQQHSLPTENHQDFQIQQAYSLNPRIKCHRWSMDQDNPFENDSRVTTPSDSKYFTSQELLRLFQSSTPNKSSSLSRQIDSGVQSSTPIAVPSRDTNNKTLLLEVAAERAFINHHLTHFGFSIMHFELYNDLNDLKVFLKYLFGHLNSH